MLLKHWKMKQTIGGIVGILLGTLGTTFLEKVLVGKGVHAGKGTFRVGQNF